MKTFSLISFLIFSAFAHSQITINNFYLTNTIYQIDSKRTLPCANSKISIHFEYTGSTTGSEFDIGYYMEANSNNKIGIDTIVYNGGVLNYDTVIHTSTNKIIFFAHCGNCSASGINFIISQINVNIECYSPLPIELINFDVSNELNQNILSWETASETNNDYFTIEHSTNGFSWDLIDKIEGAGNSNSAIRYGTKHRTYPNFINYYRLTQTDYDGKSETFPVLSIDNLVEKKMIRRINTLGSEVDENYKGMVIEIYNDNTSIKRFYH